MTGEIDNPIFDKTRDLTPLRMTAIQEGQSFDISLRHCSQRERVQLKIRQIQKNGQKPSTVIQYEPLVLSIECSPKPGTDPLVGLKRNPGSPKFIVEFEEMTNLGTQETQLIAARVGGDLKAFIAECQSIGFLPAGMKGIGEKLDEIVSTRQHIQELRQRELTAALGAVMAATECSPKRKKALEIFNYLERHAEDQIPLDAKVQPLLTEPSRLDYAWRKLARSIIFTGGNRFCHSPRKFGSYLNHMQHKAG
jgi:hypothetical protein